MQRHGDKITEAHVVMFSGCRDDQLSADVCSTKNFGLPADAGPGGAGGACTNSMLKFLLDEHGDDTWVSLLAGMQTFLKQSKYTQVPQLSAGNDSFDPNSKFGLMNPNPNGRTKALFVGINYVGHDAGVLDGCHNDVESMMKFVESQGFDRDEFAVLRDNGEDTPPTTENIRENLRALVADAQPGDSLFFHYSGHGINVMDEDGDERDGQDEALAPMDYNTEDGELIRDDEIFQIINDSLPEGASLVAVLDCCHSATLLDLPYTCVLTEEQYQALAEDHARKTRMASAEKAVKACFSISKFLFEKYAAKQGSR